MFKQNEAWDDLDFPLAYLITFRTYGTWLHGDERTTVDTHGKNIYNSPRIAPNENLKQLMQEKMTDEPVTLDEKRRSIVMGVIKETAIIRGYDLKAINVRSNHVHAVVSAEIKPEIIANAFKSNATRKLREQGLLLTDSKLWSRGVSRRYLWKPRHVALAIEYILYGQGDFPFELEE